MDVLEEGEVMMNVVVETQQQQQQNCPEPTPADAVVREKKVRVLPRCASLSDFEIIEKIGEGTFGYFCSSHHTHMTFLVKFTRQSKERLVKLWR